MPGQGPIVALSGEQGCSMLGFPVSVLPLTSSHSFPAFLFSLPPVWRRQLCRLTTKHGWVGENCGKPSINREQRGGSRSSRKQA